MDGGVIRRGEVRQLDRDEEQHMLPCRFFINGFCVSGSRCRFYHPPPAQLSTTIRVPPIPSDLGTSTTEPSNGNFIPINPIHNGVSQAQVTYIFEPDTIDTHCPYYRESPAQRQVSMTEFGNYYELDDMRDEEIKSTPPQQQTLFSHINWNEFLLPGKPIPPVVAVPLDDIMELPKRKGFLDIPITPIQLEEESDEELLPDAQKKKIREEFQLKVKLMAMIDTDESQTTTDE